MIILIKFPLKTKKSKSYENFIKVYNKILNKEHLTEEGLNKIKIFKKAINLNNSLTIKTGSSLKD